MKKSLLFPLLLTALCASPLALAELPSTVDVKQAAELRNRGTLLLDVRDPAEYDEVHAKGAILIPLAQLPHRLNEIAQYKNKPVEVICRSGKRSARAVEILRSAGFTDVANVEGGTTAWVEAGLPVVRK
ncbi:MAG TPA: rhodanese-like domain-containing protein [Gallionella sp.]|nr:rhodanese-like domain-containing protein [Gallionella sp.]